MSTMHKVGLGLGALLLVAMLVWALWPQPMPVDLAPVTRDPMQGVTRVREPYAIAAPITGTATRSPLEVGDHVVAGETVVAVIRPADPALMDARSRAQAEAAVALALAETELAHAETQLERGQALAERGTIPRRMLEDLEAAHQTAQQILAPQTGIVLAMTDQSARPVAAGNPLLTIGNLDEMEIELDLLSADAVQVPPGARALVDRWGGEGVLDARPRRIDPAAFTRVSALGIEEQRVRLRLDLQTPPEGRPGLGEGFRVHVRLIVWDAEDALQVPQAALFRQGDGWAVFARDQGRARLVPVRIGRQAGGNAELLDGLTEGQMVVLYPASALAEGSAIVARGE